MTRVPESKRIRSIVMNYTSPALVHGATIDVVADTMVFQDDVKIVGWQLHGEVLIPDACINEDGGYNFLLELSRQGGRSYPGSLGFCVSHAMWTGILSVGGDNRKTEHIIYPQGYGIELDEGEAINMLAFVTSYQAALDTLVFYGNAHLYYVER